VTQGTVLCCTIQAHRFLLRTIGIQHLCQAVVCSSNQLLSILAEAAAVSWHGEAGNGLLPGLHIRQQENLHSSSGPTAELS